MVYLPTKFEVKLKSCCSAGVVCMWRGGGGWLLPFLQNHLNSHFLLHVQPVTIPTEFIKFVF